MTHSKVVADYLSKVGVGQPTEMEKFSRRLRKRHGGALVNKLADAIARGSGDENGQELYSLKNQTLQLSLDMAAHEGDFYAEYLTWLVEGLRQSPRSVLDIGCECGVLTCFYATHFPEAQVLGLDLNEAAIRSAGELSKNLGLKNVRFERADILAAGGLGFDGPFDMVTITCVLNEALGFPAIDPGESFRTRRPSDGGLWSVPLAHATRLLAPQGVLVGAERTVGVVSTAWWVGELAASGLAVDWSQSIMLNHQRMDEQGGVSSAEFPVVVCKRADGRSIQPFLDDVAKLVTRNVFARCTKDWAFEGDAAEVLLEAFSGRKRIWSARSEFGGRTMRREVYEVGLLALIYEAKSDGFRNLRLIPRDAVDGLIAMAKKDMEGVAPGVRVEVEAG